MLLRLYRLSNVLHRAGVPILPRLIYVFNRLVFAATVPHTASIGRNVVLGYQGLGVVIHKRAVIGDRVIVGPGVTIGGRSGIERVPIIEDDVMIGAGARILGPVVVGKGAKIGANAVVLVDVPPGAVAVGVPARVIQRNMQASETGEIEPSPTHL